MNAYLEVAVLPAEEDPPFSTYGLVAEGGPGSSQQLCRCV